MAEQFEREEEKTPVFVINGFLEAGKTQFLRFTMEQSYFRQRARLCASSARRVRKNTRRPC